MPALRPIRRRTLQMMVGMLPHPRDKIFADVLANQETVRDQFGAPTIGDIGAKLQSPVESRTKRTFYEGVALSLLGQAIQGERIHIQLAAQALATRKLLKEATSDLRQRFPDSAATVTEQVGPLQEEYKAIQDEMGKLEKDLDKLWKEIEGLMDKGEKELGALHGERANAVAGVLKKQGYTLKGEQISTLSRVDSPEQHSDLLKWATDKGYMGKAKKGVNVGQLKILKAIHDADPTRSVLTKPAINSLVQAIEGDETVQRIDSKIASTSEQLAKDIERVTAGKSGITGIQEALAGKSSSSATSRLSALYGRAEALFTRKPEEAPQEEVAAAQQRTPSASPHPPGGVAGR